jgi:cbb3-type cytochrome oxidase maturation protein
MDVIVILVGCSLLVAIGFLIAFLRALRQGQFDDLVTPPIRMLFESESEGTNSSRDGGEN